MKYRLLIILSIVSLFFYDARGQHNESRDTIINHIDNYLNSSVLNGYSGSVLVAKDGEVLLSKGYGWSDRNKKILNILNKKSKRIWSTSIKALRGFSFL